MPSVPQSVEIGDAVIYQQLHDESVLLEMTSQTYFGLDDVGTRMWQLLTENGNVERAITELTKIYSADHDTIQADVHRLIQELISANLLKTRENSRE